MKTASLPSPADLQNLLNAFNAQRLGEAEQLARRLLARHPDAVVVHSVLAAILAGRGEAAAALPHFEAAARLQAGSPELQCNLGLCLTSLGRHAEAAKAYRRAVALRPGFAVAHFNLGTALQALGDLAGAADAYLQACTVEPGYAEAWGNLGATLQLQGELEPALDAYRRALAIRPHPRLHLSVGSALRNQGRLEEAMAAFRAALALDPDYAEAHDRLGSALWASGDAEAAVASHRRALALQPDLPDAHLHLATFLQDAGRLSEAVSHYRAAGTAEARGRALYCLYKSGDRAGFEAGLAPLLEDRHRSPLIATLTAHRACNDGVADPYGFCPRPLDFIYHGRLPELAEEDGRLLKDLLADIAHTDISERRQGRLYAGVQSAGHLFRRSEASFRRLAALTLAHVRAYPRAFDHLPERLRGCELLRAFPDTPDFSSAWYIRMRQGGHLTSHIHEEGWISGCVYLAMPPASPGCLDGSIEFSIDGDDYPRRHDDFPRRTVTPAVGDILLFPSSLFHRTLPFAAAEQRVCVAFDIRPAHA